MIPLQSLTTALGSVMRSIPLLHLRAQGTLPPQRMRKKLQLGIDAALFSLPRWVWSQLSSRRAFYEKFSFESPPIDAYQLRTIGTTKGPAGQSSRAGLTTIRRGHE
jgi:hypothetical protein